MAGGEPKAPPGFRLRATCRGHKKPIRDIAWSPDGREIVSGGEDPAIRVFNSEVGREVWRWGAVPPVTSIDWSPSGRWVLSCDAHGVYAWDAASDVGHSRLVRSSSWPVARWSPDGRHFSVGGDGLAVTAWRAGAAVSPSATWVDTVSSCEPYAVSWSPDGTGLTWAGKSGACGVIEEGETGPSWQRAPGDGGSLYTVAWSPDGAQVAVGGASGNVSILRPSTGELATVVEHPFRLVERVAFSPDGRLLAVRQYWGPITLWRTRAWELVATLPARGGKVAPTSLAFHPTEPVLATLDEHDTVIRIWDLDVDRILGTRPRVRTERYTNAKVVLVGDTGVGKSGLALALTGQKFRPTESTHGRRVLGLSKERVPADEGGEILRETFLWDLAGQPGYRLVHQLHMDDAALALVLFDARSETDPFAGAEYWAQALDQAQTNTAIPRFLVAARTDRGGVGASQARIDDFTRRHGFARFFRTSAKMGDGVAELLRAVEEAIPWDGLPVVSSNATFLAVRACVEELKDEAAEPGGSPVVELGGLRERLSRPDDASGFWEGIRARLEERGVRVPGPSEAISDIDLDACLGRLAATDVIEMLRFGPTQDRPEPEEYVLLEPAYVDAYASAIVIAARDEPDGTGHLPERAVLDGDFRMDDDERLPGAWRGHPTDDERLVLLATVERLLAREIALRERVAGVDYLVFPSQYTRDAPFPGATSFGVSYEFAGPVHSIFTTLVVRLAHSQDLENRDFWRDAACFASLDGGHCIVLFERLGGGRGRCTVLFEEDPSERVQRTFLEYVHQHLQRRARVGSIKRERAYYCGHCTYRMDPAVVEERLHAGQRDIGCTRCDARWPLRDLLFANETRAPDDVLEEVRRINRDAEVAKTRELTVIRMRGKRRVEDWDVFLSYHDPDRPRALRLAERLKQVGLRPWVDVWDLVPGRPWQEELARAIGRIDAAAVCLGPSGHGPWQDFEIRGFLSQLVNRDARVIPVLLPGAPDAFELPPFLSQLTAVDLREWEDDLGQVEPLKALVAGVLDHGPGELSRTPFEELWVGPRHQRVPPPTPPQLERQITVVLDHDDDLLDPLDIEAVRAQLAEVLDVRTTRVRLVGRERGSCKIHLEFDDPEELAHFMKELRAGERDLLKYFDRWQANLQRFLAENQQVGDQVIAYVDRVAGDLKLAKEQRHASIRARTVSGAISTDGDASVTSTDPGILDHLDALKRLLPTLDLADRLPPLERALDYAAQEAAASDPDRGMVANAVTKTVRTVNEAGLVAKNIEVLLRAANAIAIWCGEHGSAVLTALS